MIREKRRYEKYPPQNLEVRALIVGNGISYGELAKAIPVSQQTLSGWLRYELRGWQKDEILRAIDRIKAERGRNEEVDK